MDLKEYKEFDFEGEKTLKSIAAADKFNQWMYETIKPFCKGKVLEVGSGIGNISKFFLSDKFDLTLSDIRVQYRTFLSTLVDQDKVLDLDIVHPDFEVKNQALLGRFDTVFALNVVEHIENDSMALLNMQKLLKPDGHVIILVPAFQMLYNEFDRQLYHYRRYSLMSILKIVPKNSICIHKQYFNFMGIFGWILVGGIMRKKIIPEGNMRLYNKLVPVFKLVDKFFRNKIGLSSVIVLKTIGSNE